MKNSWHNFQIKSLNYNCRGQADHFCYEAVEESEKMYKPYCSSSEFIEISEASLWKSLILHHLSLNLVLCLV